jgi:hypothetical protein
MQARLCWIEPVQWPTVRKVQIMCKEKGVLNRKLNQQYVGTVAAFVKAIPGPPPLECNTL